MGEHKFRIWKDGGRVDALRRLDIPFAPKDPGATIAATRIFGVDTESLLVGGSQVRDYRDGTLKTVLVPCHFHDASELIETPEGFGMLEGLFDVFNARGMFEVEERPSRTKQRNVRNGKTRRDGRRAAIDPWVSVWFNLPYDFGRLAANDPKILRATIAGADTFRIPMGRYEIEVAKMHFGSSSSFEWFIRDRARKCILRLLGIDLRGYWKRSLADSARAVGVTDKIDIEAIIEGVYERPRETFTKTDWHSFKHYACGDAQSTLELYHATVDLLTTVDARVIRTTGVIPQSAPGASARIVFAGAFDAHKGLPSWSRYPAVFDQMGCDAYYGGRSFCARPGVHSRMRVLDLKGAYTFQMCLLPDPVDVQMVRVRAQPFVLADWRGKYGVLYISGECTDDVYPAFRIHDESRSGRLRYVFGKFSKIPVTIPEIVVACTRGALRVDKIHRGFVMNGAPDRSFFRKGIEKFFAIKEDPSSSPALRDMAKLLGNSCYGKLIEINAKDFVVAESIPIPNFLAKEPIAKSIATVYANGGPDPDDVEDIYFGDENIYENARERYRVAVAALPPDERRPSPIVVGVYIEALSFAGEPREGKPTNVRMFLRDARTYTTGQYFLPAYAAQITGATSAMLGAMAAALGAYQGDTDSVHVKLPDGVERIEDMPGFERYFAWMAEARYPSPRRVDGGYAGGVPTMPALGIWENEDKSASVESILVRPKVYSHRFEYEAKTKYKQAKHSFSKFETPDVIRATKRLELPKAERMRLARELRDKELHEAMRSLLEKGFVDYETRKSPRQIREAALTGLPVGEFIGRPARIKSVSDPNTRRDANGVVRWLPLDEDE